MSSLGVTGMRSAITTDLNAMVAQVRSVTDTPVAIGFGISNPEQARAMAEKSDGAIVGSALVKIVAEKGTAAPEAVGAFARELADAVKSASYRSTKEKFSREATGQRETLWPVKFW